MTLTAITRRTARSVVSLFALLGGAACGDEEAAPDAASVGGDVAPAAAEDQTPAEPPAAEANDRLRAAIRVERESENRGRLETAVVHYERDDGDRVDLIGVLHVGDADYYAELERRFAGYDAVLYEMIKAAGADPTHRGGGNPLSFLQTAICRGLDLQFQLDSIDYGADNFVHADLTAERFAQRWEERNESVWKLVMRALTAGNQGGAEELTPAELLDIVRSKDRRARMKMVMADVFADADSMLAGLAQPDAEGRDQSMLIGERNLAALEIMERELEDGERQVALFYGAGHAPDFNFPVSGRGCGACPLHGGDLRGQRQAPGVFVFVKTHGYH